MKKYKLFKSLSIITVLFLIFTVSVNAGAAGENNVPAVVNKVSPSVVGIVGNIKANEYGVLPDSENIGFGTGIIYKPEGYIITNAHVINMLENVVVVLPNSKAYQARIKAVDDESDLALIKIDKGGLTPAELGSNTEITVGESVIAIGTPLSFSLRNSATMGIISGLNRSVEGSYSLIQSDTAINAGNSGGPLVNMQGRVIGINSIKFRGIGVEGLSFSIPIDTVKYVVSHFEKYGKVKRPYLGVKFQEGLAARYGLPSEEGLAVTEVYKGSQAEVAGIKLDDVVLAINDVKVTSIIDYNEETKKYLPGDTVNIRIQRNSSEIVLRAVFGEKDI